MSDGPSEEAHQSEVAVLEHRLNEAFGRLDGAIATLGGEADELACRRPHADAHLYQVEEQLRWKAENLREFVEANYAE